LPLGAGRNAVGRNPHLGAEFAQLAGESVRARKVARILRGMRYEDRRLSHSQSGARADSALYNRRSVLDPAERPRDRQIELDPNPPAPKVLPVEAHMAPAQDPSKMIAVTIASLGWWRCAWLWPANTG
jgi:hypothetical protein